MPELINGVIWQQKGKINSVINYLNLEAESLKTVICIFELQTNLSAYAFVFFERLDRIL